MGKQSQPPPKPTEVELGLQVGVKFDNKVVYDHPVAIWHGKPKPIKSNQPDRPKHLELSLHANLQLPRLCLIYISTQDSYMAEKNKTKSKAKPTKPFKIQWIYYFIFLFYFCELSLPASFQLPKLCLIHMNTNAVGRSVTMGLHQK